MLSHHMTVPVSTSRYWSQSGRKDSSVRVELLLFVGEGVETFLELTIVIPVESSESGFLGLLGCVPCSSVWDDLSLAEGGARQTRLVLK